MNNIEIYLMRFFLQFNEKLISKQDPHSQIKYVETLGEEYPNENDSEDTKTNATSAISNFMPKMFVYDEGTGTNSGKVQIP